MGNNIFEALKDKSDSELLKIIISHKTEMLALKNTESMARQILARKIITSGKKTMDLDGKFLVAGIGDSIVWPDGVEARRDVLKVLMELCGESDVYEEMIVSHKLVGQLYRNNKDEFNNLILMYPDMKPDETYTYLYVNNGNKYKKK